VYQTGHYGTALLAYAPIGFAVTAAGFQTLALVGGALAVALAMVPDWDTRLPGIDHRGPTHTVWFAVLVGLAVGAGGFFLGQSQGTPTAIAFAGFAFLIGVVTICSHIAADSITPMGVTPFTPFSGRHITYDVVPAKHTVANYLLLGAGLAASAGAFGLALSV
jgi:inner membrane protein